MLETGIDISTLMGLPGILLALLTVMVIFIRRSFKNDVSILLMLLCALLFTKNLLSLLIRFQGEGARFYHALFNSSEIAILILLLRSCFSNPRFRYWMNYLLAAYVASVVTLHLSQQSLHYLFSLKIVEAVLLVLLSLMTLFALITNKYIFLFQSPLFWIAGGTWFYYAILILSEWLDKDNFFSEAGHEKEIALAVFSVIRLVMYFIAALLKGADHYEDDWKNFKESSQEYLPRK